MNNVYRFLCTNGCMCKIFKSNIQRRLVLDLEEDVIRRRDDNDEDGSEVGVGEAGRLLLCCQLVRRSSSIFAIRSSNSFRICGIFCRPCCIRSSFTLSVEEKYQIINSHRSQVDSRCYHAMDRIVQFGFD